MQGPPLPSDAFRLGYLVVVPSLNRLVRGGRTTDVEPRVMAVLATLAQTPGEVVTRAALVEAVWTDTMVNDEALTRAVSELRKALGPDTRGAVETIRGRGYRLAVPPEPLGSQSPGSTRDSWPPASSVRDAAPSEPRAAGGGASPRAPMRRGGVLAVFALALAVVSLAVSLRPSDGPRPSAELGSLADEPFRLDSTSQYHVPGLSEFGVYYDSTEERYFRFESGSE